jgi:hypothetical protein
METGMPDVQQIFERVMQEAHADPGALERQFGRQRRRLVRRRVAALVVGILASGLVGLLLVNRVLGGVGTTPGNESLRESPSPAPNQATDPIQLPRSVPEGLLPAGTYTTGSFDPAVTFTVGDDRWWVGWDWGRGSGPVHLEGGTLSIERELPDGGFFRLSFWDTTTALFTYDYPDRGTVPPDLVGFIGERPEVRKLGVRQIDVDGLTATRLDFEWADVRSDLGFLLPGVDWRIAGFRIAWDYAQHWIVLDTVDGQLLNNRIVEDVPPAGLDRANRIGERYFDEILGTVRIHE